MRTKKLPLHGYIEALSQVSSDFAKLAQTNDLVPDKLSYKVACAEESPKVTRSARIAALETFQNKIVKVAFDTRRVNQETTRIPRSNLQYWHRSQEFIDDMEQSKIDVFAKLQVVMEDIKRAYGTRPDWHDSYARVLADAVGRILRVKQGDNDIGRAQLAYLEQLLDARYRLTMDEIQTLSSDDLQNRILKKDESLLKKGLIYSEPKLADTLTTHANMFKNNMATSQMPSVQLKQEDALASLFGGGLRREGERSVERTVTITIKDEVKD